MSNLYLVPGTWYTYVYRSESQRWLDALIVDGCPEMEGVDLVSICNRTLFKTPDRVVTLYLVPGTCGILRIQQEIRHLYACTPARLMTPRTGTPL